MHWSEPEIGAYIDGQGHGLSYPDLIRDDGRWFFSATQKSEGRTWEADSDLLEALWTQIDASSVTTEGCVVDLSGDSCRSGTTVPAPTIPTLCGTIVRQQPPLDGRGGLTLDLHLRLDDPRPGQTLVDSRGSDGTGYVLKTSDAGSVIFEMCDGWNLAGWELDRDRVRSGVDQHVTVLVDGGPKLICFVIDGVVCDGGERRALGYGRFNHLFKDVSGGPDLRIGTGLDGAVHRVRIYDRCLLVSEAIGNQRAEGLSAPSPA
jgi:hypothetical protein